MNKPTWSDVVVAIPTVLPQRTGPLSALLEQVAAACPGAPVVLHPHVEGESARWDFPRLLRAAANVGRPWVLQLEDDVVLAPTFSTEALAHGLDGVMALIRHLNQADVVTLFSRSQEDVASWHKGERLRRIGPSSFSMSQGFFIRNGLAYGLDDFAPTWYQQHPEHNRAADLLLAAFLSERKARVFVRIPSLVQHRRLASTLPNHRGTRQSETYRLAFGEVS